MAAVKVLKGNYLFEIGHPILIVVAYSGDSDIKVNLFILMQDVPSLKYSLINQPHWTFPHDQMKMAAITNVEALGIQTAIEYAKSFLINLQLQKYGKMDAGLRIMQLQKPLELDEPDPWNQALIRLRLQGLSDEIIHQLMAEVKDDEFRKLVTRLQHVPPIVVKHPE
jgi:hypothetical protein